MEIRLHGAGVALLLLIVTTLSHAADPVSATPAPCDPWAAKVTSIQGDVQAKRTHQADWQAANLNDIYCPGDQLRVGDNARAAIVLNNETLVRLGQNSAITLAEIKSDGPSLLELLEGIAHFISRVPRSLKVNTPFVNAAIEGTEFVVAIGDQQTEVTVFEGVVLAQNDLGAVRVTQNETVVAHADSKPQKILKATPRDAVQWALYFPPIFDSATGKLAEAQQLLFTGQPEQARAALKDESSAEALSLLAIIAVVQNDPVTALQSASQAVETNPQLAAAHIAQSYALQASRELEPSLASAQQATQVEPNNALAWARVAELQLSTGDLSNALEAAQRATQLNPNLARTQTILGFAHLLQIKIEDAKTAFSRAIELDQVDPLPRLGLGLAKIRKNKLAEGRRDIEIAASLDPNNSIIRSYLGKAYFEEKRAPLDADQYAMAKELDPNDPTPWFYDAIRKQTENDPVGALEDINKSIELNDNRAVYRSSLQLDQDAAARSANLAKIYNRLGFNQLGEFEATNSLSIDPNNHAAHKLLADSYINQPRHEVARVSELMQSQLLQPLNLNLIQPQDKDSNLAVSQSLIASSAGLNDYDYLFTRDRFTSNGSFLAGGNSTTAVGLNVGSLSENSLLAGGVFNYSTRGYRPNNQHDITIANLFSQADLSPDSSLQLEIQQKSDKFGDLPLRFDPTNFISNSTTINKEESLRLGFRHNFTPGLMFVGSGIIGQIDENITIASLSRNTHSNLNSVEAQIRLSNQNDYFILGLGNYHKRSDLKVSFLGFPLPGDQFSIFHKEGYLYYTYNFNSIGITAGLSHDNYEGQFIERNETNPKFGMRWDITDTATIRAAGFRVLKRTLITSQTIEPTQVAGFNQVFDDPAGTIADRYGIAYDQKLTTNNFMGIEVSKRELDVPYTQTTGGVTNVLQTDWSEQLSRFYWNTILTNWLSASIEYQFEILKRSDTFSSNDYFLDIKTKRVPVTFNFHIVNNYNVALKGTYVQQEGTFEDIGTGTNTPGEDKFWVVDLALRYLPSANNGTLEIGAQNLLNETFNYQDTNPENPQIAPELFVYGRFNYNF